MARLANVNHMKMDVYHCFGSEWFCFQMQHAFDGQRRILRQIVTNMSGKRVDNITALGWGIEGTAGAISDIRHGTHLNEAHVLMRLLVERAITFCYLATEPEPQPESAKGEAASESSAHTRRKPSDAEELIEAANRMEFSESYDSEGLKKKLNAIQERTKIPHEFLRLLIASHYPHASAAMTGSPFGAVCHLASGVTDKFFEQEFATMFFAGSMLLRGVVEVAASKWGFSNELEESKALAKSAEELMKRTKEPVDSNVLSVHGCWQVLNKLEHNARLTICDQLKDFEIAFGLCLEAGVEAPTLPHSARGALRLKLSALFLKRVLNDLRSVWLMLNQGYTAQAAVIATSLYENALAIQCVAGDDALAKKLDDEKTGELPWGISEMCKIILKKENPKDDEAWKPLYAQYVWLCSTKHPTLPQLVHDAGATSTDQRGYAVMALPDVRKENLCVKEHICILALHSTLNAIEAFANGAAVDANSESGKRFYERTKQINDFICKELKKPRVRLPFTIETSSWMQKEIQNQKAKQQPSGGNKK
jgi:hypothetical protein